MQLFENIRVQWHTWPYILKHILPDQSQEEHNVLPLKLNSGSRGGM